MGKYGTQFGLWNIGNITRTPVSNLQIRVMISFSSLKSEGLKDRVAFCELSSIATAMCFLSNIFADLFLL